MSVEHPGAAPSFDGQAGSFDQRAGLPPAVCERVADALIELAAPSPADVVLELGAGTGAIGLPLALRVEHYIGLDLSAPMLDAFREKLREAGPRARHAVLLQADANRDWPIPDGGVRVFFASRAAHLLDEAHLVAELQRTGHREGALLVLGSVHREAGSWREMLRGALRTRLDELGLVPRSAARNRDRLTSALTRLGGGAATTRTVAEWTVRGRPADALAAWRGKPGLGGVDLPPALQREVLEWLEAWARARYGGLEAVHESTEHYELTAIRPPVGGRPTEPGGAT